jgi:hypothetical protein
VVVLNQQEDNQDGFSDWGNITEGNAFRALFRPAIIRMDLRLPNLQHAVRNHGFTMGKSVAGRSKPPSRKKSVWLN